MPFFTSNYCRTVRRSIQTRKSRCERPPSTLMEGEKQMAGMDLVTAAEACTPKVRIVSGSSVSVQTTPKSRKVVAPKCAAVSTSKKAMQPSAAKMPAVRSAAKTPVVRSAKGAKPSVSDYGSTAAKSAMAAEIALQNQAVKRQKLDGGKARQIINVKGRELPHKWKLGSAGDTDLFTYGGRNYPGVAPYVSTAEMVKNFQMRTREIDLSRNGSLFHTIFLPVVGLVDPNILKPGDLVGVNKDSYLILDTLPSEYDSRIKAMEVDEKPTEDYNDVGGQEKQIQELVEAIVLPMTHKERFQKLGVQPPKGVLLYGPRNWEDTNGPCMCCTN